MYVNSKADPSRPRISVVIPTRNEARNIGVVLAALPDCVDEVVLVDGDSIDCTVDAAVAARPDLRVVRQSRTGKGNALAAGFEAARGRYIVMMDADGSMDPAEIAAFIAVLDAGADYAKGSRYVAGGGSDDISALRDVGNRVLSLLTNIMFRTRFTDLCYGYNAFTSECVDYFRLPDAHDTDGGAQWGDGFEVETLINIRVARSRLAVVEVSSFEHPRLSGESNLRTFRDGMRVLLTILAERFHRERHPVRPVHVAQHQVIELREDSPALAKAS